MRKFLSASIGRKFLMSITGLFLLVFVTVHLIINLLMIFDDTGELYNQAAHFMATNPVVKIMEPILAIGFIFHILWSFHLEFINRKARGKNYDRKNNAVSSTWASRNMLILGSMIAVFLIIHLYNFYWIVKFNSSEMGTVTIGAYEMHDTYALVAGLFVNSVIYCLIYVAGGVLLGLHISHGFWSAFQTIGFSNKFWMKRLHIIANAFAIIIGVGYSIIPLYFLFGLNNL